MKFDAYLIFIMAMVILGHALTDTHSIYEGILAIGIMLFSIGIYKEAQS